MSDFAELVAAKGDSAWIAQTESGRLLFGPDMGARVFCELDGMNLHRLDMATVRDPHQAFNNYGGNNFWPAPEGGIFGYNYDGDTWVVQKAINDEPFVMAESSPTHATAVKQTALMNRKKVEVPVTMSRAVRLAEVSTALTGCDLAASLAYVVEDEIAVIAPVSTDDALIACWTLEQFAASFHTQSFVKVAKPEEAINFDFYADPRNKINYVENGFRYQTDSKQVGQIGIRKAANAEFIGFYDLSRQLVVVRELIEASDDLYFNIADNDQGQWSIFRRGQL